MRGLRKNYKITIFGSTGDIGSHFANHLLSKGYKINLVIREGTREKLSRRVQLSRKSQVNSVESLFDKILLRRILLKGGILYNFAGQVSLSYKPNSYASVLSINAFLPAVLVKLNQNCKIVYASTQRVSGLNKRKEIRTWSKKAKLEFNLFWDGLEQGNNLENQVMKLSKSLLRKNPIPVGINIYEISKILGEEFLKEDRNSIIIRISSCYGPGCSARRTVGRLVFARLLGSEIVEREEVRDFLYIEDLSEVLETLISSRNLRFVLENGSSGESFSKSSIITQLLRLTPFEKGGLSVTRNQRFEEYRSANKWFMKRLHHSARSLKEGLERTVHYFSTTFFTPSASSALGRFEAIYDVFAQATEESGIDQKKQDQTREKFFRKVNGLWKANEAYWKPTGVVFGFPFDETLTSKLQAITERVLNDLGVDKDNVWIPRAEELHATIVHYSHYSESGVNVTPLPDSATPIARKVVGKFEPIKVVFRGVVITTDGSLLAKGYVETEDIKNLRKELVKEIPGILQREYTILPVKLAQIFSPVPYESVQRVNRLFASTYIGVRAFNSVRTADKTDLTFKNKRL